MVQAKVLGFFSMMLMLLVIKNFCFDNNLDNFTKSRVGGASSIAIFDFEKVMIYHDLMIELYKNDIFTMTGRFTEFLENGDVFVEATGLWKTC